MPYKMQKLLGRFILGLGQNNPAVVGLVVDKIDQIVVLLAVCRCNGPLEISTNHSTDPVDR